MRPYVTASAQSAGWIWTIPLYSRLSYGYVYCSSFLSADDAERELRRYCGDLMAEGSTGLRLQFTTGKLRRLWVRNCVAIGLAGGFIEPLESTGLAIVQMGVEMLASMLDARYFDERMPQRYDAHLEKFYRDIMQFIIAHYALTNREDSAFWRAVKHDTVIPDDLAARLAVFRTLLPTTGTKGLAEPWMFRDLSWFSVLLGMHFDFAPPAAGAALRDAALAVIERKRREVEELERVLPNHYDYLSQQVYRPSSASSA
jgi:tryptophan halogenase